MTTNESIMSEMLERATNREAVDELAMQMFVLVVQKDAQMVTKAQEMLIAKIRSHNETESTRAVTLLEECMTKCGSEFQDEIAKFRFLNELIRLVSKKYQGDTTPIAIKKRIMECLLLWTTEFPSKTKIREAYDMLKKVASVEHGNSTVSTAKREKVLGIDDDMLSKLIESGDPVNFKRANLYIQYHVNQEARRMDLRLQQKSELQEIQNTVSLLNQMLDTYEAEGRVDTEGSETINLIGELYLAFKKHRTILQQFPDLIGNNDDVLLADALEVNDALQTVMKRYKDVIVHPPTKVYSKKAAPTQDLLLEFLGIQDDVTIKKTSPTHNGKTKPTKISNALDELSDIFGSIEKKESNVAVASNYSDEFLEKLELLRPINVLTNIEATENVTENSIQVERRAFRELSEIDKLSDELFKQNLQTEDRVGSFKKKEPEKLTLNELFKEKTQNVKNEASSNTATPIKKAHSTNSHKVSLKNLDDDEILDMQEMSSLEKKGIEIIEKTQETVKIENKPETKSKSLSEIEIDLDNLTPCDRDVLQKLLYLTYQILVFDGNSVVHNKRHSIIQDRPSKNISVIVIAVSNRSKKSLKDFHFEASVKKPCKVRLLPPTDNGLPPYKPYRPPTPINQVLILLNPTGKEVDLTCIVGYKLGNDPDPIKESVIAKNIPYVE